MTKTEEKPDNETFDVSAKLAEALGIDTQQAQQMPAVIQQHVFFDTLAKHGINPRDEQQATDMLSASDVLEEKQASMQRSNDPINRAIAPLLKKKASSPEGQQQRQQYMQQDIRAKTAAYLEDPNVFGALLTAFSSQ